MNQFVKTKPGADPIVVESRIEASPAQVFQAWTKPNIVEQWFGSQAGPLAEVAIDLRPGGSWRFVERADEQASTWFEGHYQEIASNERLVFTWRKVTIDETGCRQQTTASTVEIEFQLSGCGTDLRITHSNLDPDSRIWFRDGWNQGVGNLVALFSFRPGELSANQLAADVGSVNP